MHRLLAAVLLTTAFLLIPARSEAQTFIGDRYAATAHYSALYQTDNRLAWGADVSKRNRQFRGKSARKWARTHRRGSYPSQIARSHRRVPGLAGAGPAWSSAGWQGGGRGDGSQTRGSQMPAGSFSMRRGYQGSADLGGRPHGCPYRFCGCALSLHIYGRQVPGLNLASNWFRFPRAAAAPSMVAVRRGHVFQLLAHVSGTVWRVWDANSGRGRIRVHERSIAGYGIVNPHGSRLASR